MPGRRSQPGRPCSVSTVFHTAKCRTHVIRSNPASRMVLMLTVCMIRSTSASRLSLVNRTCLPSRSLPGSNCGVSRSTRSNGAVGTNHIRQQRMSVSPFLVLHRQVPPVNKVEHLGSIRWLRQALSVPHHLQDRQREARRHIGEPLVSETPLDEAPDSRSCSRTDHLSVGRRTDAVVYLAQSLRLAAGLDLTEKGGRLTAWHCLQ